MVDVNLKGVIYGSHLALEQFRKQGHGVLVNLGSVESGIPLAYWSHRIAPDLAERFAADVAQTSQMEHAPATQPPTSGSLYQSPPTGTGVDGGVRARMQREDAARKGKE